MHEALDQVGVDLSRLPLGGHPGHAIVPDGRVGARAPGWDAGLAAAHRQMAAGSNRAPAPRNAAGR